MGLINVGKIHMSIFFSSIYGLTTWKVLLYTHVQCNEIIIASAIVQMFIWNLNLLTLYMSNYSVYVNYSTLPKMVLHIDSESSLISKYVYYRGQADPPVS